MNKVVYFGSGFDATPVLFLPDAKIFSFYDMKKFNKVIQERYDKMMKFYGFDLIGSNKYIDDNDRVVYHFQGVDITDRKQLTSVMKNLMLEADTICYIGAWFPFNTWELVPNIRHVILGNITEASHLINTSYYYPEMMMLFYHNYVIDVNFYAINNGWYEDNDILYHNITDQLSKGSIPKEKFINKVKLVGPFKTILDVNYYNIKKGKFYLQEDNVETMIQDNFIVGSIIKSIADIPKKVFEII